MTKEQSVTEALMPIWQRILNREVNTRDDFFESGGNSYLALRLGEEIDRSFGRALPVGIVFYHPTIEKLAEFLAQEAPSSDRVSLVPLQVTGAGKPVFIVHWIIREVVKHLGKDRPIYGLSFGLAMARQPEFPSRIEDLAAHYIAEMRLAQPHGSYTLIGYSAGGVVAYEMAQQLIKQGETIDFLGLIDTYLPRDFFYQGGRLPLRQQVLNILRLPLAEIYDSLFHWYIAPLTAGRDEEIVAYHDFMMAETDFWLSYTPKTYQGKLTLFIASGIVACRNHKTPPEPFWITLNSKGDVETLAVPGRHRSMINGRNAKALAATIEEAINAHD